MDSCDSANLLAFPGDENGWKGKGPMLACPEEIHGTKRCGKWLLKSIQTNPTTTSTPA
jgi:hypothetical protein